MERGVPSRMSSTREDNCSSVNSNIFLLPDIMTGHTKCNGQVHGGTLCTKCKDNCNYPIRVHRCSDRRYTVLRTLCAALVR
jgi:hypothetical protein